MPATPTATTNPNEDSMAPIGDVPDPGIPYLPAAEVRRRFLDFFVKRCAHTHVPSSPTIPHDDPTLLFANAGMNQFKPVFLGKVEPSSPLAGLKRVANSQKCIRAGGKHNDLEDVGRDTYHHTFFEMLGNWSFGDYFKAEAIDWAWQLLTQVYKLPADRLYATYFKGNPDAGLEPDNEARELWLKYLPAERIVPGNMKDNFWEMGDTGPCGPCTEIHYDRIGGRNAAAIVNSGDPDVLEIWNLVFIQFDRQGDGSLRPLPARHVDTGMGFERLVSVVQNRRSNYDTDVFAPIFAEIERITGAAPYRGRLAAADVGEHDTAYRVIADHIRTLTFAITDGAAPSNEGRGYVLRRILRRAVRYGHQMLGAKTGFLSRLVPSIVGAMGDVFPELRKNPARVAQVILEEEESFAKTLDRGIVLFGEAMVRSLLSTPLRPDLAAQRAMVAHRRDGQVHIIEIVAVDEDRGTTRVLARDRIDHVNAAWLEPIYERTPVISGPDAFQLYDTFGFPPDLTALMARERGLGVDEAGYERAMEEAREKSRAGAVSKDQSRLVLDGDAIARLKNLRVHPTDDSNKFNGRDIRASVRAIWNGHNFDEHADASATLDKIGVILDRTNHYAEMGGQVGDHGRMLVTREARTGNDNRGGEFVVEDTQAFGGYVLHIGRVSRGEVRVGDDVTVHVGAPRRKPVQANHTATHLLNWALRNALGEHVDQKGSLVDDQRLRFDFTNAGPVEPAQLAAVERRVRERIDEDLTVYADLAPLAAAKEIEGLRAVFGEAYPDPVRVVSIGQPVADLLAGPKNPAWRDISVEFCGGTHVASTREIDAFALISETGIAKGIRRVEALTGVAAIAAIHTADALDRRVRAAGALPDQQLAAEIADINAQMEQMTIPLPRKNELRDKIAALVERAKGAAKSAAREKTAQAQQMARQIAESAATSLERIVVAVLDVGSDRNALQAGLQTIRDRCPACAIMLFSPDESDPASPKVSILAGVPKAGIDRGLKAGDWVREAAAVVGGKGGGKPDLAQGGGSDLARMREAIGAARTYATRVLTT
jgi:alanyl-tRNA synthetase